jgi:NitT/TauT family transport system substrate-binding protein
MRTLLRILALLLPLALLLAACGDGADDLGGPPAESETEDVPAPAPEPEPEPDDGDGDDVASGDLRPMTFVAAAAIHLPNEQVGVYAVAKELGYFEDEGLDVTLELADGSTAAVQAVASGSGDVTGADVSAVLSAGQQGVPIKAVGGLVQNWPWRIAVAEDSDIQSAEDLDGRAVGVISLASGSNPFARAFIDSAGLVPEDDVAIIPVGLGPPAAAAMESGEVDALAFFTQAYATLENAGFTYRFLDNPPEFDLLRSLVFTVSDRLIEQEPETVEAFGRAAYRALLFSAANPEAAMRIGYNQIPDLLPESGDPEEAIEDDTRALEAWLQTAVPEEGQPADWGEWGDISQEEWDATQSFTIEAGQIDDRVDLDRVWDPSLLDGMNDWDRDEVLDQADGYEVSA